MLTPILLLLALPPQAATPQVSQSPVAAPEAKPTPDGPVIAIETSMGTIQLGLYATKAPLSTRNMMSYVKSGFFPGTTFHRVMPGFMIQGGGMDAKMVEKPTGPPVRNEARNGLSNTRGSLALARTDDPHSATSQFFINLKDNPMLDFGVARGGWGYTVFGEVLSGMEVVDAIAGVPTTRVGQHENVPIKPVLINSVRIVSEPPPTAPAITKAGAPTTGKPSPRPAAKPAAAKPAVSPTPKSR